MLYAIVLQLQNWAHWHMCYIKEWLKQHTYRNEPEGVLWVKDLRDMVNLYYTLNLIAE